MIAHEPSTSRLWRWVLDPLLSGVLAVPRAVVGPRRGVRMLLAVPMLGATLLVVHLVWAGLLYPLRSDAGGPEAWGGPSLAGAWAVHALVALAAQAACLAGTRGLGRVQDRLGSSPRRS